MDLPRAGTSKDDEHEEVVDEPPKKVFKTITGTSAILDLKNELLKKRKEVASIGVKAPTTKQGVLYVKKDEKNRLKLEAQERREKISEYEEALRKEAEERIELVNRRLKEKAELYEKLQSAGVAVDDDDAGEGLIDFNAKRREAERERERERQRRREEEEAEDDPDAVHHVASEIPRQYGASHVIFSKNEDKRQKEIADLLKMTEQTDKNRQKTRSLAEKREEARRAKERALREKLGLPPLPELEPQPEPQPVDPVVASIPLPDAAPKAEEPRPLPKEREWDRGKGSVNNWIRSRREERDDDFAPPSFY